MYDFFSLLNKKRKQNNANIISIGKSSEILSMFDYQNCPDNFSEHLEKILMFDGVSGVCKINGGIICGLFTGTGNYDEYHEDRSATVTTLNGEQIHGYIDTDIVRVYNNNLHLPELDIAYYSDKLAEIDTSLDVLLQNSRETKLPIVHSEKDKEIIITARKAIREGKPMAMVSATENLIKMISDNGAVNELELTNPETVKNIQYILKAYSDINDRFYLKYGMAQKTTNKMAQVSEAELSGNLNTAMIYPKIRLNERKKAIKKINEIFGTNIIVDFSEPWKNELIKEREFDENEKGNADINSNIATN